MGPIQRHCDVAQAAVHTHHTRAEGAPKSRRKTRSAGTLALANFTDSGASGSDGISNDNSFDLSLSGNDSGATVNFQVSTDGGSGWVYKRWLEATGTP